jgi:hypothetical protein
VSGWPKRSKLAHAFLWGYSDKRLELAQLLGQRGAFLTWDGLPLIAPPLPHAKFLSKIEWSTVRATPPVSWDVRTCHYCRGAWARVTIDQSRRLALQTC